MSRKYLQTKKTTLSFSISDAETSFQLDGLYKLDGTSVAASDIGDFATFTIGPGTSAEEICSITSADVTVNADGTISLVNVVRGLLEVSPYTTGGFTAPHGAGSVVVFSNNPQLYNQLANKSNDEAITGYWTAPDPLSAQGIVTRDYMLSLINGGPINVAAIIEDGIAGETVAAGDLLYFSETDNEWLKTDADTLATVFNVRLGIAQGAGVNGGAIASGVLTKGQYTTTGLTQGDLCFASNTAGGINSGTPGTTPRVIGIAKDATTLYFDTDFQSQLYSYAVDAVGTDSYAVTMAGAFSAYYPGMEVTFKAGTANTGACTLNVNGSGAKTIKKDVSSDLSTGDILANQIVTVVYDGTNFQVVSKTPSTSSSSNVYTANDTWTKPSGATFVKVVVIGAGGGGGGAAGYSAGNRRQGGSAAAGGSTVEKIFRASDLSSTVAITVGAGGAGGAGGSSANGSNGSIGGNSSFGTYAVAYGGGLGGGGTNLNQINVGGSGAGTGAAGSAGGGTSNTTGGFPANTAGVGGSGGQGAGAATTGGQGAEFGGGSGGATLGDAGSSAGTAGGASLFAGGGGGGGGGINSVNAGTAGSASGGTSQDASAAGGTGTAGNPGTAGGTLTGYGTGAGGGGGASNTGGTGGVGGAGGIPGGGGGGGGGGTSVGGAGGAGGRGEVRVFTW